MRFRSKEMADDAMKLNREKMGHRLVLVGMIESWKWSWNGSDPNLGNCGLGREVLGNFWVGLLTGS